MKNKIYLPDIEIWVIIVFFILYLLIIVVVTLPYWLPSLIYIKITGKQTPSYESWGSAH